MLKCCWSPATGSAPCRTCLRQSTLAAVMRLAGLDMAPVEGLQMIPLLFDDTISLNKRRQINAVVDTLYNAVGDTMPADEKYFRIGRSWRSARTRCSARWGNRWQRCWRRTGELL